MIVIRRGIVAVWRRVAWLLCGGDKMMEASLTRGANTQKFHLNLMMIVPVRSKRHFNLMMMPDDGKWAVWMGLGKQEEQSMAMMPMKLARSRPASKLSLHLASE